jgi:hypothetical protein
LGLGIKTLKINPNGNKIKLILMDSAVNKSSYLKEWLNQDKEKIFAKPGVSNS